MIPSIIFLLIQLFVVIILVLKHRKAQKKFRENKPKFENNLTGSKINNTISKLPFIKHSEPGTPPDIYGSMLLRRRGYSHKQTNKKK